MVLMSLVARSYANSVEKNRVSNRSWSSLIVWAVASDGGARRRSGQRLRPEDALLYLVTIPISQIRVSTDFVKKITEKIFEMRFYKVEVFVCAWWDVHIPGGGLLSGVPG